MTTKPRTKPTAQEAAEVERLTMLMHVAYVDYCEKNEKRKGAPTVPWITTFGTLPAFRQNAYRHVALALIRDRGKEKENG